MVKVEGNLESMSVGAMVEIIKNELAEVRFEICRVIDSTINLSKTNTTTRTSNLLQKIKI